MMQSLCSLKKPLAGFHIHCCRCYKTFSRSYRYPESAKHDFGKFFTFLRSVQNKSLCSTCDVRAVENSGTAPLKKIVLSDESMAGILGSHKAHGTRQVWCPRRYVGTSSLSATRFESMMKHYLVDLIASRQMNVSSGYYPSSNGEFSTDLKRFLSEVGTDPREARYWLKQFKNLDSNQPFAVIQVGADVFNDTHELENLVSCISFLQRNGMRPIVIHGNSIHKDDVIDAGQLKTARSKLLGECMLLTSMLEVYGTQARPLFSGSTLIQADQYSDSYSGVASTINSDPINWCLQTRHVPVIPAVGETLSGQILVLDLWSVTEAVATLLQPLKVMEINTKGGFTDKSGNVVPNVNLPTDLETVAEKPWCTPERRDQIERITCLLQKMPPQSSVVLTAADTLLQELFTHHGSGTFFKITEPVLRFSSLEGVDRKRLAHLLMRAFGRELKGDYLIKLEKNLHTLYLSEGYNAAAVITGEGFSVPYLDKFAVSMKAQGEGTGEMVWECVRKDFPKLFWRSRGNNSINPWYFKKSEGSWSDGQWTVFWYGVPQHRLSSELIDYALTLESSFLS